MNGILLRSAAIAACLFAPLAASAADIGNGARIYNTHCIGCHGVGGQSALPEVPKFATGDRLMQPDFTLMQTIRTGKGIMPSFFGILRDQEMLDVIAYIRTLRR